MLNWKYLLYVIDAFTKHAWVKSLKEEKSKTVSFKIANESNNKSNKLWVNQRRGFYNSFMQ